MSLLEGNDTSTDDVEDLNDDSALDTLLQAIETVDASGKFYSSGITSMKL